MSVTLDVDFGELPTAGNRWLEDLDRIREAEPVFWSDHQRGWLITRHADVLEGFQGRLPLSNYRLHEFMFGGLPRDQWSTAIPTFSHFCLRWIVNIDPPDHTRLRRLLVKAFNKKVVDTVRPLAQNTINSLLDMAAQRPELEFAEEIARVIPARTLFHLLGIPEKHLPNLARWSVELNTATSWPNAPLEVLQVADRMLQELTELFRGLIAERRKNPGDDLISAMVHSVVDGERLSEDDVVGICQVLLVAGQDTASNSLTLGVEALARWPEQRRWLVDHPQQIDATTMELSRYIAMSGGQNRIAAETFEWHGKTVKKGDIVYLMIAPANRDPRVFKNPTALDFTRSDIDRVVTFGPGLHHCVGHLLARMQINEFNLRAYTRFREIEVLEPRLQFNPGFAFRSPKQLHVRFHS